ncbi:hypothetical protein FRC01_010315 [Tulasnella sp. 417]|nr:hypothetical protein FRC01_010315 [Tulasnella sp. 417]
MSPGDKAKVKSAIPQDSGKIICAFIVRIYYAHPDPSKWTYTGQEGALALVANKIHGGFWFKMVDLEVSFPAVEVLPGNTKLMTTLPIITLELPSIRFPANERDASAFFTKVNGRAKYSPKNDTLNSDAASKKAGKASKINKEFIKSAPGDFRHIELMGYSPETGFTTNGLDKSWITIIEGLKGLGVTNEQLKDNEDFIGEFLEKARAEGQSSNKAKIKAPPPLPPRRVELVASTRSPGPPQLPSRRVLRPTPATQQATPPGLGRFGITEEQIKGNEQFIREFVEKAKREGLDAANRTYGVSGKP